MEKIKVEGTEKGNNTEINSTQLIMGTGDLFRLEADQIYKLLDAFVASDGNTIDMAHQYVQAEEIIGQWMKERGNRQKLKLLTKGAHPDDGEPGKRVNPKAITKDLLESLQRLQTDYVDFYALHRDDLDVEVGPIMETLNEHISEGHVRAIGTSNWTIERIREANEYASKNGLVGFTFNSPNLSLAKANEPMWPGCVSAGKEEFEWHKANKMPLFAWSSQAGGFFSGGFSPDKKDDEDIVRVYYSDENWERYRRAQILAERKSVTPIQIALAYVLNQPFPTAAIVGPMKTDELYSSVQAAGIQLSEQEVSWLDFAE